MRKIDFPIKKSCKFAAPTSYVWTPRCILVKRILQYKNRNQWPVPSFDYYKMKSACYLKHHKNILACSRCLSIDSRFDTEYCRDFFFKTDVIRLMFYSTNAADWMASEKLHKTTLKLTNDQWYHWKNALTLASFLWDRSGCSSSNIANRKVSDREMYMNHEQNGAEFFFVSSFTKFKLGTTYLLVARRTLSVLNLWFQNVLQS